MAAKTQAAPVAPRLAPVVLIKGSESLLADRALSELRRLAHEVDPSANSDLSICHSGNHRVFRCGS